MRSMLPAMHCSNAIGSVLADSDDTLMLTFVRGTRPRWSFSNRSSAGKSSTHRGRFSTKSRYFRWYSSASRSLTHASPSRSTLNASPSFQSLRSFGTADRASCPAMNFSAMPVICDAIVLATVPFIAPPAFNPSDNPGGAFTPG